MKTTITETAPANKKIELFLKALAGETIQAECIKCGVVELIVPLDDAIDEAFLANYHCDDCDSASE